MNHLPPDVQEPGKDDPLISRKGWKRIGLAALGLAALIGCRTCYVNERDQRAVEQQQRMDPQAFYIGPSEAANPRIEFRPALDDFDKDGDLDSIIVMYTSSPNFTVNGRHVALPRGYLVVRQGASREINVEQPAPSSSDQLIHMDMRLNDGHRY